jgi:CheY-like chemotaxis protein
MKPNRTFRILLVDDDDIFALLLRESISEHEDLRERFEIDRVSDGDQAVDYLLGDEPAANDERPRPDLILLDQRMPRMDGTAVLKELRASNKTRSIPVCMLSTSNQPKQVSACYAGGANFCIMKPANLEALVSIVGQLLHFVANVVEMPMLADGTA